MVVARADAPICCEDWGVGEWWLYSAGSGRAAPGAGGWWPCAGSGTVGAGVWGYCEAAGVVMGVAGAWFGGAAGCVTGCADLCIGMRGRNIERQGRGNSGKHSGLE